MHTMLPMSGFSHRLHRSVNSAWGLGETKK